MKKEYIKPEVDIVDVELSSMISTSVGEGEGDSDIFDANDRRGSWGDLWSEDEE